MFVANCQLQIIHFFYLEKFSRHHLDPGPITIIINIVVQIHLVYCKRRKEMKCKLGKQDEAMMHYHILTLDFCNLIIWFFNGDVINASFGAIDHRCFVG